MSLNEQKDHYGKKRFRAKSYNKLINKYSYHLKYMFPWTQHEKNNLAEHQGNSKQQSKDIFFK